MDRRNEGVSQEFLKFNRSFLHSDESLSVLGDGELGGKGKGLAFIRQILRDRFPHDRFPGIKVRIPTMAVLTTDRFVQFMEENRLYDRVLGDVSDDRIAHAFLHAELPPDLVGDLWALASGTRQPLAVRSSSLLEDARNEPFAGIYETKMVPNNQDEASVRFQRLVEAVKLVYASTFFSAARDYRNATGADHRSEQMAVVIQEVVGSRRGDRFYPVVSGVGRSFNHYPFGHARPEDGVVSLALGLGKTIVDGGACWTYCPRYPTAAPPVGSVGELMKVTQAKFWSVNMGQPPEYDPMRETEYLVHRGLDDAMTDGTLESLASTYDPESDRLRPGAEEGCPTVLNFAPVLDCGVLPINEMTSELLRISEEALGTEVEIEFAVDFQPGGREATLGFLQVRPMVVSRDCVTLTDEELTSDRALLASRRALGNGTKSDIRHVLYVRPEAFEAQNTRRIAAEIGQVNRLLQAAGTPCVLIGFGRWGSSDPWLGIPVTWGQVSSARVLVESTLPQMNVELSQGSHFFHNLTAFRAFYFPVPEHGPGIRWEWLDKMPALHETALIRCVELPTPLTVKVDGRTGKGVILA